MHGVVPPAFDYEENFSGIGDSDIGFVCACLNKKQSMYCFFLPDPHVLARRCILNSMGQSRCQCLFSLQFDLQDQQSAVDIPVSQDDPGSPMLTIPREVPRSAESFSRFPEGNSSMIPLSSSTSVEKVSSKCPSHEHSHLRLSSVYSERGAVLEGICKKWPE